MSNPRIVCAANRHRESGALVLGARHFDRFMGDAIDALCTLNAADPAVSIAQGIGYAEGWVSSEQGFINQIGTFLTREEAWKIAETNGQIIHREGLPTGKLFSEHLY